MKNNSTDSLRSNEKEEMKNKIIAICLAVIAFPCFGEETTYDYDFTKPDAEKHLKIINTIAANNLGANKMFGIDYSNQFVKPLLKCYYFTTIDGVKCFHGESFFPVVIQLEPSFKIDEKVKSVELLVVWKGETEKGESVQRIVLGSRSIPTGSSAYYRKCLDDGIGCSGYSSNYQLANALYSRRDGFDRVMYVPKTPFNMVEVKDIKEKAWVTWKLVYDHEAHSLTFYRNGEITPFITMHEVDMSGVDFKGVCLNCYKKINYKQVRVTVTRKK